MNVISAGLIVVCHVANCTLICAAECFGQSCEKIQTVFIFVRYRKNTAHVQEIGDTAVVQSVDAADVAE